MFWVYILFSSSANRFYVGQTNDLNQRILRHNAGYEKSTAPYLPWVIVCSIQKESRSEAMILERKIKNLNHPKLIAFIAKYGNVS